MIRIKISGKNIERFIKRLNTHGINIHKLVYVNHDTIIITISKSDYDEVLKLKSIYEVSYVDSVGYLKKKALFFKNRILILSFIVGLFIIYFLSNMVFSVEVIYNDSKIRELLIEELRNNGIYPHTFKKSYEKLEEIKAKIISSNRDTLEWIEIENVGTKYIVRVEERKDNPSTTKGKIRDIVAKTDARIISLDISSGSIVRHSGDYVKKGDVIVSGTIMLNENIKGYTVSDGKVYGEVWYKTSVSYPLYYYEERDTNRKNNAFVFTFLSKRFELFKKFDKSKSDEIVLLDSYLLPIKLSYERQKEVKIIEQIYTYEEALNKALELSRSKIEAKLKVGEYIISEKYLSYSEKDSKIEVEVFYSICEEIGEYQNIIVEGE